MNSVLSDTVVSKAYDLASIESGWGYINFLEHVVVDAQPKKKPFRLIAEKWQWDRSLRSAPALDNLAGVIELYDGPRSFWNGYHKGSDKTHDDARELCWLLGWSKRRLHCYVCAGKEEQAALITKAMRGILLDNPWIAERVSVTELKGYGESGSELTILPMNAYTGQGIFPDYLIASEITHWMYEDGRRFWEFILESVNKRPSCVLKVETNAGMKATWQWDERNRISKSKFWSFYEAPVGKPLPTWMNQEKIDDDSQGLTTGERDRLYKNRWVDPGEELGYLTLEECEKCVDISLTERTTGERYTEYFAVVDYGGVHDRCALTVMHTTPLSDGRLHATVDRLDCWQGSHTSRVDINIPEQPDGRLDYGARSVEGWLELVRNNFRLSAIIMDPHQLEALAIKYERKGLRVERFRWRQGQNNHRMAQLLKTCVQNRLVTWGPDAGRLSGVEDDMLAKELSRLVIKEMAYGYKFDHEAGRHDDRACAVAMGLVYAIPETKPDGPVGPIPINNDKPLRPLGADASIVLIRDGDYAGMNNLFGVGSQGSAWERGDISGRS